MKKVVAAIVGCGMLVGAIIYFLSKKTNKIHNETDIEYNPSKNKNKEVKDVIENNESLDTDITQTRNKAASVIYERHQEASKIIQESMNNIFNTNEKTGMHTDELNDISNELDELLKENK